MFNRVNTKEAHDIQTVNIWKSKPNTSGPGNIWTWQHLPGVCTLRGRREGTVTAETQQRRGPRRFGRHDNSGPKEAERERGRERATQISPPCWVCMSTEKGNYEKVCQAFWRTPLWDQWSRPTMLSENFWQGGGGWSLKPMTEGVELRLISCFYLSLFYRK